MIGVFPGAGEPDQFRPAAASALARSKNISDR
jgi:hypothetical protein